MKTKVRTKIIALISVVLTMTLSCTDDYLELNTNKSLITEDLVQVNMIFTGVLNGAIVDGTNGFGTIGNYSGMSVSGANVPFVDLPDGGAWSAYYSRGRNLNSIIYICKKKDEAKYANKIAMARILKAHFTAVATDAYGDIPYSESFLPLDQVILSPKYDKQKDIYTDLFKELKEAVAQLDKTKPSADGYGNADILYKGNVDKWIKLANSIRLRLAMRIRYVDPAMAAANMSDLNESNLITVAGDNAVINTSADLAENYNPLYNTQLNSNVATRKNYGINGKPDVPKTFLDILKNNNDPRLKVYADTAKAAFTGTARADFRVFGYRGRPLLGSAPVEQKNPYGLLTVSKWSDLFWVKIVEMPLFKCSETYFLLSEAALFGLKGSPGDAQTYYKKGLQLALENAKKFYDNAAPQLPEVIKFFRATETDAQIAQEVAFHQITTTEITNFLATPVATLAGSDEEKLEQIINQKMVSLLPDEYEAWAEYRRTGYPRILVGNDQDALKGQIPRRLGYPTEEATLNGDNYLEAVDALGGVNTRKARIWWDAKNPIPIYPHPETVETRPKPW